MFSLKNKTAILLGGAGVLGADMAKGLAAAGANIAVADFAEAKAKALAAEIAENKLYLVGGILRRSRGAALMDSRQIAQFAGFFEDHFARGRLDDCIFAECAADGHQTDITSPGDLFESDLPFGF